MYFWNYNYPDASCWGLDIGSTKNLLSTHIDEITRTRLHIQPENSEKYCSADAVFVTAATQNYIIKLREPPNSKKTIKEKGSSNPLIDTGQMMQSVTSEVGSKKVRSARADRATSCDVASAVESNATLTHAHPWSGRWLFPTNGCQ